MPTKLTKMIKAFFEKFFFKEKYSHQTFTYFIPAPPKRDSGYREKQFDKTIFDLLKKGYEIVSINTESINQNACGMWVIMHLKTENLKDSIDLNYPNFAGENDSLEENENEKIEGLYYID